MVMMMMMMMMLFVLWWVYNLDARCLLCVDLCEDIEVKQQIVEIIETMRNKHQKLIRESGSSLVERRRSSARRYVLIYLGCHHLHHPVIAGDVLFLAA